MERRVERDRQTQEQIAIGLAAVAPRRSRETLYYLVADASQEPAPFIWRCEAMSGGNSKLLGRSRDHSRLAETSRIGSVADRQFAIAPRRKPASHLTASNGRSIRASRSLPFKDRRQRPGREIPAFAGITEGSIGAAGSEAVRPRRADHPAA